MKVRENDVASQREEGFVELVMIPSRASDVEFEGGVSGVRQGRTSCSSQRAGGRWGCFSGRFGAMSMRRLRSMNVVVS